MDALEPLFVQDNLPPHHWASAVKALKSCLDSSPEAVVLYLALTATRRPAEKILPKEMDLQAIHRLYDAWFDCSLLLRPCCRLNVDDVLDMVESISATPPLSYRHELLQGILTWRMRQGKDLSRRLLVALSQLEENRTVCYQTFHIEGDERIVISSKANHLEDDSFMLAEVLWPSSYILADMILDQVVNVKDKSVIELGSGVGLVARIAIHCGAKLTATDGSDSGLLLLKENLHGGEEAILKLDWTTELSDNFGKFDIVLIADCWYHQISHLCPHLARWAKHLLNDEGQIFVIAADRGDDCIEKCVEIFQNISLQMERIEVPRKRIEDSPFPTLYSNPIHAFQLIKI